MRFIVTLLCLSSLATTLIGCRSRSSASSVRDDNGDAAETLDLRFGFSDRMAYEGGYFWTKFVITLADRKIYFMNANKQKFHYEFAVSHIDAFRGMTPAQFDAATLHNDGRLAISGGVMLYNGEILFDLVSGDTLEHEFAIQMLELARSHVTGEVPPVKGYMPVFNQVDAVRANVAQYEQRGFKLRSAVDLAPGSETYALGWTFGRLVKVPSAEIDQAFADGRLKTTDILFTDGVPAEIPVLAGVISSYPATPNSHVAILSQSYGIPFAYTRNEAHLAQLEAAVGRDIIFRTMDYGAIMIYDQSLTKADKTALASLKKTPPLRFPAKQSYKKASGAYFKLAADMAPSDAVYFGGKSLNFKVLQAAIPDNFPAEALGLSFDVWDEFMDGAKVDGVSLRVAIDKQLQGTKYPPTDMSALKAKLDGIRKLIRKADFPKPLADSVIGILKQRQFAETRKIRFRSSTNVEDGDSFSGAGLYDSYSGCLGDDLDPNRTTTACAQSADAGAPADDGDNEPKGTLRAIKRVFASFYNDNAYLERLRRKVPPAKVGMAITVHYSLPDNEERANGVITVAPSYQGTLQASVVSQKGAESITNPVPGVRPEIANIGLTLADSGQVDVYSGIQQFSGRVPTGGRVLDTAANYEALGRMVWAVAQQFKTFHQLAEMPKLDMEYKWAARDGGAPRLEIKQVRIIPEGNSRVDRHYVVGREIPLCTVQCGSFGLDWRTLISNHYLKSKGSIVSASGWLDQMIKDKGFITAGGLTMQRGDRQAAVDLAEFTVTKAELAPDTMNFGIRDLDVEASRATKIFDEEYRFDISLHAIVDNRFPVVFAGAPNSQILLGSDGLMLGLKASTDSTDLSGSLKSLGTVLYACDENPAVREEQTREWNSEGISIRTKYAFSRETIYKQESNLAVWGDTEIAGLTSQPFKLTSDAARSYAAGHHNFSETFLFDPHWEPALAASVKEELRQKNIRYIVAEIGLWVDGSDSFSAVGFDGQVRKLGQGRRSFAIDLPGGEADPFDTGGGDGWDPIFDDGGGIGGVDGGGVGQLPLSPGQVGEVNGM